MKDCVLVLGCHRGGTSSLAGAISILGARLPNNLMPALAENPKGFFESDTIFRLNDRVLASAGSHWADWRSFNHQWFGTSTAAEFKKEALEEFKSEFGSVPLAVLKDPRICRFAPFWFDILSEAGYRPSVVIPVRRPFEVAESLRRRNGFPRSLGYLIWLRHMLDAELSSRTLPRAVVTWSAMLEDWREALNVASGQMGLPWPRLSALSSVEMDAFLEKDLRHHADADTTGATVSSVEKLADMAIEAFRQLAADPVDKAGIATLDQVRQAFDDQSSSFSTPLAEMEVFYRSENSSIQARLDEAVAKQLRTEEEHLLAVSSLRQSFAVEAAAAEERLRLSDELRIRSESAAGEIVQQLVDLEEEIEKKSQVFKSAQDASDSRVIRLEAELQLALLRAEVAQERLAARTLVRNMQVARSLSVARRPAGRALNWKKIDRLGLFDAQWYASQMPGLSVEGAVKHYCSRGAFEGRDPHPFFNSRWFALRYPELVREEAPIIAYIGAKNRAELSPHPLFSPEYYLRMNPDVEAAGIEPFLHFVANGEAENRRFHPLIDPAQISASWQGFGRAPNSARTFLSDPEFFNISPHPLFDAEFYLSTNPDVRDAHIHPLIHYLLDGWREGRAPHPYFDGDWYLWKYQDVLRAGENPLLHFVLYGIEAGRDPNPLFSTRDYLDENPDVAAGAENAFVHYLEFGHLEARAPSKASRVLRAHSALLVLHRRATNLLNLVLRPEIKTINVDRPLADFSDSWAEVRSQKFYIPEALDEFFHKTDRDDKRDEYGYLLSVVADFSERRAGFLTSQDFRALAARARMLSLARAQKHSGRPEVSIIIPVYNNLLDTLVCLVSLLTHETGLAYEVILADDASTDITAQVVGRIGGVVQVMTQRKNLGFLGNCNTAAEGATGKYVVFLNNDTVILSGWLDRLIGTLKSDETAGLVGSKLLNWNGTLQEAGGILWRDGSAWNFGRNQDPLAPEFNYLKEVDYCSGAAIAFPMRLWRELGGFDPLFTPAYCEDSDIAFRVRALGYKVLYQPAAEVVHYEGRSHGQDVKSGIKAYQVANQRKLFERWRPVLEAEHFTNGDDVFLARDRSRSRPHILVVDHYVPQWDRDAGSRTIYHYLRMLVGKGFHVTFWGDNLHFDPEYAPALQNMGIEVIYGSEFEGKFSKWISENGLYIDFALLSRPHVAMNCIGPLKVLSSAKIFYYGHDLHFMRLQRQYELDKAEWIPRQIERDKQMELMLCSVSDVYMYPSQTEIDEVTSLIGTKSHGLAIPMNIFADEEIIGFTEDGFAARDPHLLMFIGGFAHTPNLDAIRWFLDEVWPQVRAADPRYRLIVAGSNPPEDLVDDPGEGVSVLGRISDEALDDLYRQIGMSIAPLRYGAGVKGKVIEALARATPVVTTSTGAEGIDGADGFILVADTPDDFAAAILSVSGSADLTRARVEKGIEFIRGHYSTAAVERLVGPYLTGGRALSSRLPS